MNDTVVFTIAAVLAVASVGCFAVAWLKAKS